ncbi:MAG: PKD domain-containing protein [Deltaproteobacteria bacterium]|nr:PKD domain-containing protein [Deltaproteobacteria bacterium]
MTRLSPGTLLARGTGGHTGPMTGRGRLGALTAITLPALVVLLAPVLLLPACGSDDETVPPGSTSAGGAGGSGGSEPDGGTNLPPVASFVASPSAGVAPLTVQLDGSASTDPDGTIVSYTWSFGDGATGTGSEVDHDYTDRGCHEATLVVEDDAGATDEASRTIVVTDAAPSGDPVVTFDVLPLDGSVVPRDVETHIGTAMISGVVTSPGYHFVVAELRDGDTVTATIETPLCEEGGEFPFELAVPIPAELVQYDIDVRLVVGDQAMDLATVLDIVAGDVLLVQGQSNAVAQSFTGDANVSQGPFLRSFGTRTEDQGTTATDLQWRLAEGNVGTGPGAVGQWTLRMGRVLIDTHAIPLAIINGARGGQPIGYFQRNDADPSDLSTNYGRLLTRVRAAGLEDGIRAILFYQGESDGSNAAGHHDGFLALHADWAEDYQPLEQTYVTQIRLGCGGALPLREVQRSFADELTAVSVMSTTGLNGHDGCHYAYQDGYEALGERYAALLGRDLLGADANPDIDAPNPESAVFSAGDGTEITVQMRDGASTLTWDQGAESNFALEGGNVSVVSGQTAGSTLILTLSGDGSSATGLSYGGHSGAGPWVTNATGVGLLAFHDFPVAPN